MITCEHCGKVYQSDVTPLRCRCGGVTGATAEIVVDNTWVKLVKRFAKPQDKGVGDTVQRISARFGGERFKKFAERIGIPCGCTDRQQQWNELWPY